jgi:hypothetical protein
MTYEEKISRCPGDKCRRIDKLDHFKGGNNMDKFKIRGGDFIGIFIPGTILLLNIYLSFSDLKSVFCKQQITMSENVIIFLMFFILAYTVGVALRLLPPDLPDWLSSLMHRKLKEINKPPRGLLNRFPYFVWFMEEARYSMPDICNYFDKFDNLLNPDIEKRNLKKQSFERDISKKDSIDNKVVRYKDLVNYCKLYVIHESNALGEEVLFAEGLSRMVSGLFYSILISVIPILFSGNRMMLILPNAILFVIIIWGTRQLRVKEVSIILSSYGIILKLIENSKGTKEKDLKQGDGAQLIN